jgi:hypothetical protein
MTRNATRDALFQAARESYGGAYAWTRAVDEIRTAAEKAYAERGGMPLDADDFAKTADDAVAAALADGRAHCRARVAKAKGFSNAASLRAAERALAPGGRWHPDTPRSLKYRTVKRANAKSDIFKVLEPAEWAKPVAQTEFLISKVLCRDTFGVNAGPKKSLKTHDNQAIAFAVATGTPLYRNPLFPVHRPGLVLYIVGEGGEVPVRRTLHRMGRAYGLNMRDVAADPAFPLVTAFGAAPLDGDDFRDELRSLLDKHQPTLVLIESFYNFHPRNVEAGNLFERGQIIDSYHRLVREECVGATSLMTDHFRSTAGKNLDLDSISMAGQAENADSWLIRFHRKEPAVSAGEFWLRAGFGSRQWGGTEWDVDWHLGEFDHDLGHHVGSISWDVHSSVPVQSGPALSDVIAQLVDAQPFALNRDGIVAAVNGRKQDVLAAIADMIGRNQLATRKPAKGAGHAPVFGPPGKHHIGNPGGQP